MTSFNLNDIHIVGFSLGAQVAGKAGVTLNGALARITGLDPATDFFVGKSNDEHLEASDAIFVDIIHSMQYPQLGDMDFWPNGGTSPQPGTEYDWIPDYNSHMRATVLFIESIQNPTAFSARKANSYDDFKATGGCDGAEQFMGEPASPDGESGSYYLDTNAHHPYGKGQPC